VEIAKMMADKDAPIVAAGGMEDGGPGTSFEKISRAVDEVYSDEGVAILVDMGSAVMTAELVIESMEGRRIKMLDGPVAEGAVLAAVEAKMGSSLETIARRVEEARGMKKLG
jgi:dihydroxyacetone kinase DhaKLM complex PTS-EIIA-like component DhaM